MAPENDLAQWHSEIATAVKNAARFPSLEIRPPRSGFDAPSLARRGFPAAIPLWNDGVVVVALLPLPKVEARRWPCIVTADGEGLVLATDACTALPRYWLLRLFAATASGADRLAEGWAEAATAAGDLHAILGGRPEALSCLAEAAGDSRLRSPLLRRSEENGDFEATYAAIVRRIDSADAFLRYAAWFDARRSDAALPPPRADEWGPWGRQAIHWSAAATLDVRTLPLAPRLEALEGFAGIGSGVSAPLTWSAQPGAASGAVNQIGLAESLAREVIDDPVTAGLVEAVTDQGLRYDGYAHAEAVVALNERGEADRAWGALHSAAWWQARRRAAVPAILDGARMIAEEQEWEEGAWAVRQAAGEVA